MPESLRPFAPHRPPRVAAVAVAVAAALGIWSRPASRSRRRRSASRRPRARSPPPTSTPCPARARRAGWRRDAPRCSPATASSRRAIRCREAGLEILRQGGNAIDAAVATGAVLDVTSQNDTGIGGDLFALVYVARDKKLYALNSAGWAPAGWTPEFFTETLGVKAVPAQRRERGDGAGRDLRLRRAAEALRHDDVQGNASSARPASPRKAGARPSGVTPICARASTRLRADPDSRQTFLDRRRGAAALQHHPQSRARRRRCA